MTPYAVELTATALSQLQQLLESGTERYTLNQRVQYARMVRSRCLSLAQMPRRYPACTVQARTYRKAPYQAHVIYYSIDDTNRIVIVNAILHGRQDPHRHL